MKTISAYRTVAPTTTIVSLAELKSELGIVDDTSHDTRLNLRLAIVTDALEKFCNQCFVTQTFVEKYSCFPSCFDLEKSPVQSVAITYYDEDNTLTPTPLDASNYYVLGKNQVTKIVADDQWPNTYDRPEAVTVTYVCGYSSIPAAVKGMALKLACMEDLDREGCELDPKSFGVDRYIAAHRKGFIG
jgi:hypothetical protein